MTTGAWIVVAAVVLALAFGLWRLATDGRFRGTDVVRRPAAPDLEAGDVPVERPGAELVAAAGRQLGERATLLQFSSAFCAPCRATRRVLGEVTGLVDGVTHVEIDAEEHLEATADPRHPPHAHHDRARRHRHRGDPRDRGAHARPGPDRAGTL